MATAAVCRGQRSRRKRAGATPRPRPWRGAVWPDRAAKRTRWPDAAVIVMHADRLAEARSARAARPGSPRDVSRPDEPRTPAARLRDPERGLGAALGALLVAARDRATSPSARPRSSPSASRRSRSRSSSPRRRSTPGCASRSSRSARTASAARGARLRYAVGELLTCTRCVGSVERAGPRRAAASPARARRRVVDRGARRRAPSTTSPRRASTSAPRHAARRGRPTRRGRRGDVGRAVRARNAVVRRPGRRTRAEPSRQRAASAQASSRSPAAGG